MQLPSVNPPSQSLIEKFRKPIVSSTEWFSNYFPIIAYTSADTGNTHFDFDSTWSQIQSRYNKKSFEFIDCLMETEDFTMVHEREGIVVVAGGDRSSSWSPEEVEHALGLPDPESLTRQQLKMITQRAEGRIRSRYRRQNPKQLGTAHTNASDSLHGAYCETVEGTPSGTRYVNMNAAYQSATFWEKLNSRQTYMAANLLLAEVVDYEKAIEQTIEHLKIPRAKATKLFNTIAKRLERVMYRSVFECPTSLLNNLENRKQIWQMPVMEGSRHA